MLIGVDRAAWELPGSGAQTHTALQRQLHIHLSPDQPLREADTRGLTQASVGQVSLDIATV